MNKRSLTKLVSVMLVAVLAIAAIPFTASAAATATQITSASELVTGEYVIATDTGFAMTVYDSSKWVLNKTVTPEGGVISEITPEMVWTVTVSGTSVKLTDSNGQSISPSGGNTNGITTGDYSWNVTFADGKFQFAGVGDDTVLLASNNSSSGKFRAYKTSTVSGNPEGYPTNFYVYKVNGEAEEAPIEYISVKDARDASTGTVCYIEALISFIDGKNIYLYDDTASIVVYLSDANSDIKVGDIVKATGTRGAYNGLEQLGSGSIVEIVSSNNEVEYKEVTLAELLADQDTGALEAAPVVIKNLTLGEINTSGNTPVTEGENSINIYKIPALEGIEAGATVDVKAVVGDYKGYQLRVADAADVTLAVVEDDNDDEGETDQPGGEQGGNEDDEEEDNPSTGDAFVVIALLALISALSVAVVVKKQRA